MTSDHPVTAVCSQCEWPQLDAPPFSAVTPAGPGANATVKLDTYSGFSMKSVRRAPCKPWNVDMVQRDTEVGTILSSATSLSKLSKSAGSKISRLQLSEAFLRFLPQNCVTVPDASLLSTEAHTASRGRFQGNAEGRR